MTKYYPFTRILILPALIFTFYACKKDKDTSDPNKTYLLSKVHSDGRVSSTFEYNDQHQLIKHTSSSKQGSTFLTTITNYVYGTDGRLARKTWNNTGSIGLNEFIMEYEY